MGCVHGKCCCCCSCSSCCRTHTIEGSKARLRDRNSDNEEDDRSVDRRGGYRQPEIRKELPVPAVVVPSHGIRLEYASLTQKGHYPDSPDRENQDCLRVETRVDGNPNAHFFAVFDGHGHSGSQCSNFAKRRLFDLLTTDPNLLVDPARAYASAFHAANVELHENEEIDDSMSGTTAVAILLVGDTLHVANVGDSRAVAGVWDGSRNAVVARDLSRDQTPFRKDEYERVKGYGARVLSVDQVEGLKDPSIQSWGEEEDDDEGDPPRVWVQDGMYPGTAFTRSIGDSTAEEIGVTAEPEVLTVQITPDYLFFVLASDGVFEFLPSQVVIDMVAQYNDPRDACSAITEESYRTWLEHETRTDDITVIVVHIKDACNVVRHCINMGWIDT